MRVLVTGGSGFIGSNLVASCVLDGLPVALIDSQPAQELPANADVTVYRASVWDRAAMRQAFDAFRPTLVYHLAAMHYIPECDADPMKTWRTNVDGTRVIVELATRFRARFVLASSAAVYRPSESPHRESDPIEPIDVYGRSKMAAELILRRQCGSVDGLIARLFNVYGVGEQTPHLVPRVVSQVAEGADRLVLGALNHTRDWVHVDDAVAALRVIADLPGGTVVNVATGSRTSVREVVDLCASIVGRPLGIIQVPELLRPVDRPSLCGDASLLRSTTEWNPRIPLRKGLEAMLDRAIGGPVARAL